MKSWGIMPRACNPAALAAMIPAEYITCHGCALFDLLLYLHYLTGRKTPLRLAEWLDAILIHGAAAFPDKVARAAVHNARDFLQKMRPVLEENTARRGDMQARFYEKEAARLLYLMKD